MRVLVIGDIHGNYKALMQVLQRSSFDYEKDFLITLGDIVDGLPDSFECVEELLKIKNRIDIKGNHDEWFRQFIVTGISSIRWEQGGIATAKSYGQKALGEHFKYHEHHYTDIYDQKQTYYTTNLVNSDIPSAHQNFFRQQYRYYVDDDGRLFIHAGFNRHLHINQQVWDDIYYWDRDLFLGAMSAESAKMAYKMKDDFKQVFLGHTATMKWATDQPIFAKNIINVDTGAGFNGRLTLMDISTKEYWQSDTVKELYPEYKGR